MQNPPRPDHLDKRLNVGQLRNDVRFRGPHIGDNDDGPRTTKEQVEGLEEMSPSFFIPATKLKLDVGFGNGPRTKGCCATGNGTCRPNRPTYK